MVGADSVAIQLLDAADGAGASSNYSGLEFGDTGDNELTLLQGCSDGQILKWNDSSNVWYCAADTSGGVSNYWQIGSEGLAPYNTTLDLYIGGTSTGPATFSVAAATGNIDTSGTITAATDETINGIDINAGAISDVTTLNATSTITFSGIGTGTDDSVVILNGSNQLTTDEIDSRVWGTSLVDGTGSSNQVAYWSDGNTIAGENYLSSSRGGTGLDASTAGNGMLLIGNGSGLSLGYITGGTGIDIASTSGNITISHADLSAQGSVDNSGTTVIQDVTMDTLGHVTGLSSVDLSSSFDNYQSWSAADDDADTYAIVSSNILRFTSSDSNVLTNLTNGDDSDENMDFSVRLLGDLVSGSGLTGGADNILVGADTDITLSIGAGNGIVVGADSVAIQLLDAADGAGASSNYSGLEFGDTGDNELTLLQGCSDGQILKWNDSSNVWYCSTDQGSGSGSSKWTETTNLLYPNTATVDVLFGGSSTSSAKFAFTGVNLGVPTASIAGTTGATYLTGDGNLATTLNKNLTIGGTTTGTVILDSGTGGITLSDATTLSSVAGGSTNTVLTLGGTNVIESRSIDSRVWGSTLTDASGTPTNGQAVYWSDANTLAAENYLSTTRGGTGLDASTAGNGMLLIGNGSGLSLGYITGGIGITVASTSGNITLSHADVSSQGTVDNSGTTVIQDVTMDTLGHVTGLSSVDLSSSFDNYQSWSAADDDADTYAIVSSNILRFTSSDSNVLTNLTNGDDSDENMDFSVRLLGDLVSGSGLTGGADNILVGADTDITLSIGAGNGIVVGADSVAIQLLDAADGAGASSNYSGLEFGDTGDNELTLLQGCSDGQILKWNDSSNVWYCSTDQGSGSGSSKWTETTNLLYPNTATVDVLFGGSSTSSAKFAFTGVNLGVPTASIAGTTGATYLTGDGNLATTLNKNLTIGGTTTGTVILDSGTGGITLSDATTLSSVAGGSTNTVLTLGGTNVIESRSIDSRVWGSTLTDASGTPTNGQAVYWSDANTLAAENYLSTTRGGTGLDASTAGNGMLLIGNGSGLSLGYITGGIGITVASTSGNITLSHADVSSQGTVDNSGTTVIQDVTMDTLGHVTGLSSVDLSSSFDNYQSWSAADDDADTYAIVSSNILRFTSSDSNVLTNLTNGDDSDENMDFSVRLLGDLVSGSGLTGGADNILVGADTDITLVHRSRKRYRGWC